LVTSGYLPPKNEGTLGILKTVGIGSLVVCVIVVALFHVMTRVLFQIELSESVAYRNLLGRREVPWESIARFELEDRRAEATYRILLRAGGKLTLTTMLGEKLTVLVPTDQWERVR